MSALFERKFTILMFFPFFSIWNKSFPSSSCYYYYSCYYWCWMNRKKKFKASRIFFFFKMFWKIFFLFFSSLNFLKRKKKVSSMPSSVWRLIHEIKNSHKISSREFPHVEMIFGKQQKKKNCYKETFFSLGWNSLTGRFFKIKIMKYIFEPEVIIWKFICNCVGNSLKDSKYL